jgi:3-(3-hydroxy-phenyl)propionate hydroxylase
MAGSKANARVVIVGAGPVGMVCALALNRSGIAVTVFEQEPAPVEDQRAASLHPSTLEMLDDLGVTEQIIPLGLISSAYRFHDRVSHSVVAEFDLNLMRDEFRFPYVLQYEQYKLTASIAKEYGNSSDFDVRFSHAVTDLTETADGVDVEVSTPDGVERLRADYVIGCDGGRSTVRKLAGIEFEGLHLSGALHQDRDQLRPWRGQSQGRVPQLFFRSERVVQSVQGAGQAAARLWRAIFPIQSDETDEAVLDPDAIEARLQKFFSEERPLRGRIRQRLWRASARRGKLSQRPRAARRRLSPRQQPDRRHGHERRHP